MGRKYFNARIVVVCGFLLILVGFMAACSDEGPTGTTDPDLSGTGQIDPRGDKDFLIGSTSPEGMSDGRIDVWAHNLAVDTADMVVSLDIVLINRSRTAVYPPVWFFITKIIPDDVVVLNSDIVYIRPGPPGFDFSDDLGDDNKLDAGEASDPVNVQFWMPELKSFSIGFNIIVGSPPSDAVVSGVVFHDANENGVRDNNEPGIPGVKVHLSGEQEGNDPFEILRVVETDGVGHYGFPGVPAGIYEIKAVGHSNWRPTTPNPMIVTLIEGDDGVIPLDGVDFGFFVPDPPPIEPVFGPVPVGPASPHGPHFEGLFLLRVDPNGKYFLTVTPPPLLGPIVLMRIDTAKVWLNGELIYRFWCDGNPDTCYPATRVEIPNRLLVTGSNHIEIIVEGNEHAMLLFSIVRADTSSGG
jgi:hypothetical protein